MSRIAGGAWAPPAIPFQYYVHSAPVKTVNCWRSILFVLFCGIAATPAVHALDTAAVKQLAAEDGAAKIEAINKLVASGDIAVLPLFKAMQEDALQVFNGRLVIVAGDVVKDAMTGATVDAPADKLEAIVVNNRIRGALDGAIAALKLVSPKSEERLAAAKAVANDASEEMLPLVKRALEKESERRSQGGVGASARDHRD